MPRRRRSCRSTPATPAFPKAYEIGTRAEFDRRSAWWSSNFVGNWTNLNFDAMIQDVRDAYTAIEDSLFAQQPVVEKVALELYKKDPNAAREYITAYSNRVTQDAIDAWWKLADTLVVKYQDAGGGLPGAAAPARAVSEGLAGEERLRHDEEPEGRAAEAAREEVT